MDGRNSSVPSHDTKSSVAGNPSTVIKGRPPRRHKKSWLLLLGVFAVIGLALRITTASAFPASVEPWLPWLNVPTVTVYFPDNQGRFLVPITRRVDAEVVTPQGAVRELLRGPKDQVRLVAQYPRGIRLDRLDIQDGVAVAEVNMPRSDSADVLFAPLAVEALARTLQGFPEVDSIRLVVNGVLLGDSPVPRTLTESHYIYHTYGPYLVPVAALAATPKEALSRYLEGPGSSGLGGLPKDVRLLEYRFDNDRGLAYANFTYTASVRRIAQDNPSGVRRTLTGIIATLTDFPEVKAAMLDFEGHARLGLGQCADLLRTPQVRPRVLNEESQVRKGG